MARIIQQWTRFTRNSFQKKPRRQELLTRWPLCDYTFFFIWLNIIHCDCVCSFYSLCDWRYQSMKHTIRIWLQFKFLLSLSHIMKKFNVFNVASIFVFVSISFLVSLISAFSVSKLKFSTLRFTAVIISFFYRRCESLVHLLAPPSLMVFIIYLIQPPATHLIL